jgi:hypothetical protein
MANAAIYGQFTPQPRSIADYANEYARGDALRANTAGQLQQNTINAMTMDQNRAAQAAAAAKQNAIMQLATETGGDPAKLIPALYQRGYIGEAQALEKHAVDTEKDRATAGKTRADTTKTTGETADLALKRYQGMLSYIDTPQGAARWLQAQYQDPATGPILQGIRSFEEAVQGIPQEPQAFQQWRQQAGIGMEKVAQFAKERELAKLQSDTQIRGQDVSAATQRRGQDISASTTIRGQNLTDSRAREANTSTVTKPFEVTGPDGVPILVRQDKAGNISRVEGFGPKAGAAKPLNDTQAKALLFGSRMQEADKVLTSLESAGVMRPGAIKQTAETAAGFVPFIGDKVADAVGSATNWTQSPDQQKVEQAQRDFVNAVLRRESGAVISDSEFRNAAKQYFPSAGDSPEVRKQKAANRALATRGLMAEVPTGQRGAIASQPANTGGVTVDWSELK